MKLGKNVNIYQDTHHGGWVLEVFPYWGETDEAAMRKSGRNWHRIGTYGTRAAAVARASEIETRETRARVGTYVIPTTGAFAGSEDPNDYEDDL